MKDKQNMPLRLMYRFDFGKTKIIVIQIIVCVLYGVSLVSSVQSFSCVWLFETPLIAASQTFLSITNSQHLIRLMSIDLVMPPPSNPLSSPSPSTFNLSQPQSLFQWVSSSH